MKKSSTRFNEQGDRIHQEEQKREHPADYDENEEDLKFFRPNETRHFDEVVRDQVYNCLLYRGDFQNLMT